MVQKRSERFSLEKYGIFFRRSFVRKDCPKSVREIYQLVHDAEGLRYKDFRRAPDSASGSRQRLTARYEYEKELVRRAQSLKAICTDTNRETDGEDGWVMQLQPIVFARLSREFQEKQKYNYCYTCQLWFDPKSRVRWNRAAGGKKSSAKDPSQLCNKHPNLPELESGKIGYYDDDSDTNAHSSTTRKPYKVPDLTIGLLTYSSNAADIWRNHIHLLNDNRVKLFDRGVLEELLPEHELEGGILKSSPRVASNEPIFGFLLWEAKPLKAQQNQQSARNQTARKTAQLLRWQRSLFSKTYCELQPVVWQLTSVGSDWLLYGCHCEEFPPGSGDVSYYFTPLWKGDSMDQDKALQLLYIMEIIAVWAERSYKPTIGACLKALDAQSPDSFWESNEQGVAESPNMATQIFPWMFDLVRKSGNAGHGSPVSQIPELVNYTWISNQDPGTGDILVIRIDSQGNVRKPLVVFESQEWAKKKFPDQLKDELESYDTDVDVAFMNRTTDGRPRQFRKQLDHQVTGPENQVSLIVSLKRSLYTKHTHAERARPTVFRTIEALLNVTDLLAEADDRSKSCCECQVSERDTVTTLCSNARCQIGWYHKDCVGLEDDDDTEDWLCEACNEIPVEDHCYLRVTGDTDADQSLLDASDDRVQWTRTLAKVWKTFDWPSPKTILLTFSHIAARFDIEIRKDSGFPLPRHVTVARRAPDVPGGSWVVDRKSSERLLELVPLLQPTGADDELVHGLNNMNLY